MNESNAARIATEKTGRCPHCHRDAHFGRVSETQVYFVPGDPKSRVCTGFYICQGCDRECLIQWVSDSSGYTLHQSGADYKVTLPAEEPRSLSPVVPEEIRSLYGEASMAEAAGALRAAGVMYRAAVEAIAKDKGALDGNLYKKIEALEVTADLKADLHEARLLGNYSIHDAISFDRAEVEDVAELVEEACHVLYVQPQERATWRERRKERRDRARQVPASGAPDQG